MVLFKDENFADGLGLHVHIRTELVRFWSFVKSAAIRIGDDILEVEGSVDGTKTNHYWYNYEYQGDLNDGLGTFPVTSWVRSDTKRFFEIDLDKVSPQLKIQISTGNEFVRIDVINPSLALENTIGIMGNYTTGKTLARDGATVIDDFIEYGNEWQVIPSDEQIFHQVEQPQFPRKCIDPVDPRGERHRRLGELSITEEKAEAACAHLESAEDRKDCVYDVLATQDIGMVGAY